MKNARKIRMIPEHGDVFGGDPKLQFNFFWLAVHNAIPMPANGGVRKNSFRQPLADQLQFLSALCVRFGVSHFESLECVENNLRDDQPGVFLVVGGNDIPWRILGTCCTKAFLICLHVMLPEFSFLDVHNAEFPVLFRLVDAFEKALSLLLLRQVEIELYDEGSVAVKVSLQIHNGTIPIAPDCLLIVQSVGESFAAKNLGMDAGNQNLFVVGSVEDADPPAFR